MGLPVPGGANTLPPFIKSKILLYLNINRAVFDKRL